MGVLVDHLEAGSLEGHHRLDRSQRSRARRDLEVHLRENVGDDLLENRSGDCLDRRWDRLHLVDHHALGSHHHTEIESCCEG